MEAVDCRAVQEEEGGNNRIMLPCPHAIRACRRAVCGAGNTQASARRGGKGGGAGHAVGA